MIEYKKSFSVNEICGVHPYNHIFYCNYCTSSMIAREIVLTSKIEIGIQIKNGQCQSIKYDYRYTDDNKLRYINISFKIKFDDSTEVIICSNEELLPRMQ